MQALAGYSAFLFFAWLIYKDRERLINAWRSRHWLPTKAIVIAIEDQHFELDAVGHQSSYVSRHRARLYRFRYSVDGMTYETDRFSFDGPLRTWNGSMAHEYPSPEVGDESVVFFNPSEPQTAVAHRGFSFNTLIVPFIAVFGLAWGVWNSLR